MCRGRNFGRDFFSGGSEFDTALPFPFSSVLGCFEACVSCGVDGRVRISGLSGFRNEGAQGRSLLAVACACSGTLALNEGRRVFARLTVLFACAVEFAFCRVLATPSDTLDGAAVVDGAHAELAVCSGSAIRLLKSFCDVKIDFVSCVMKIENLDGQSRSTDTAFRALESEPEWQRFG